MKMGEMKSPWKEFYMAAKNAGFKLDLPSPQEYTALRAMHPENVSVTKFYVVGKGDRRGALFFSDPKLPAYIERLEKMAHEAAEGTGVRVGKRYTLQPRFEIEGYDASRALPRISAAAGDRLSFSFVEIRVKENV